MTSFFHTLLFTLTILFTLPLDGYNALKVVTFRPECIMQGVIHNPSNFFLIMLTKATLPPPEQKLLYYQESFENHIM